VVAHQQLFIAPSSALWSTLCEPVICNHESTHVSCSPPTSAPSRSSGALYQSVTTRGVMAEGSGVKYL
jgi:hypothetical protein